MAFQTMSQAFDERRPLACARVLHRFGHGLAHLQQIVAIHGGAENLVCLCVPREALDQSMGGERRELGITVVLANEDYRQPPQARDIEGLMKRAGLACAVPEKHDGDLPLAFLLGSESR